MLSGVTLGSSGSVPYSFSAASEAPSQSVSGSPRTVQGVGAGVGEGVAVGGGLGCGVGLAVGFAVGAFVGVGDGVAAGGGLAVAVADWVAREVGEAVAEGVDDAVRVGPGVALAGIALAVVAGAVDRGSVGWEVGLVVGARLDVAAAGGVTTRDSGVGLRVLVERPAMSVGNPPRPAKPRVDQAPSTSALEAAIPTSASRGAPSA